VHSDMVTRSSIIPLSLYRETITKRWTFRTYDAYMRLQGRSIPRHAILDAVDTDEVVETSPQEGYMHSDPILVRSGDNKAHRLFATNAGSDHVRVGTVV
jgi:hypothetical protein